MNKFALKNTIRIILTTLLLLCLLDMPYGYYQFVRVTGFVLFGYLAYIEYKNDKIALFLIYLISALLFNPIFKVILGREIWQVVDITLSIMLLGSLTFDIAKSVKNKS